MIQQFNENMTEVAPIYFLYEKQTQKSLEISATLKAEFLNNSDINNGSLIPLNQVIIQVQLVNHNYFANFICLFVVICRWCNWIWCSSFCSSG